MVEYKGALDVISKTFRSVGAWYENLIFVKYVVDWLFISSFKSIYIKWRYMYCLFETN